MPQIRLWMRWNTAKIQAMRPGLKVLFISGYAADIIAHPGILDAGVNLIRKPFGMNELAKAVQNIISC
jgi:two-component system cell cycle sensor histidine kinase/response regulator CckA